MRKFYLSYLGLKVCLIALFLALPLEMTAYSESLLQLTRQFDKSDAEQQRIIAPYVLKKYKEKNTPRGHVVSIDVSKLPLDSIRAEVWLQTAIYLVNSGEFTISYEYFSKVLSLVENGNNERQKFAVYSMLSYLMYSINDLPKALEYGHKSLQLEMRKSNPSRIILVLNNMATLYNDNGYPKDAIPYIQEGMALSQKVTDLFALARFYGTTAEVCYNLGKSEEANKYIGMAYKIVTENPNINRAQDIYYSISHLKVNNHQPNEAFNYIERGMKEANKRGDKMVYNKLLLERGRALLQKDLDNLAASDIEKCLRYFQSVGSIRQEEKAQLELFYAYKKDFPREAMDHLIIAYELKDSIDRQTRELKLSQYSVFYKNQKLEEQNKQEHHRQIVIVGVGMGVVLVLLLVLAVVWYKSKQRRRKMRISEEQNKLKDQFFTNITHEFRTPLTIIQMAAQAINDNIDENEQKTLSHHVTVILREEKALLSLINNLMDIAKMKSMAPGHEKWKRGDLVSFTRVILESFTQLALNKHITLDYHPKEEQLTVDFVPTSMKRIIVNLVSNSIKYSNENTSIVVSTQKVDEEHVQICVKDHGIGMTPEECARAFDPFYQANEDANSISTGVGLALVKSCVEAMNGTISVESEPGKGTEFTVTMPLKCGEEEVEPLAESTSGPVEVSELMDSSWQNQSKSNPDDKRPVVLVVEDSSDVAAYTGSLLKDEYQTVLASNGIEGLEKATKLVPDLIISDIMMPGMDGFELCKAIRSSDLLSHIPVILISAKITDEDRIKGLKMGADEYLTKPFNRDVLRVRVETLLKQRRLLREKYAVAIKEDKIENVDWNLPDRNFYESAKKNVEQLITEGNANVNALADRLCMSARQLQRRLQAVTGQTPLAFIDEIRIKRAMALLAQGNSVAATAAKCGFDEPSNLARKFKKTTGMSPSQWLKSMQNGNNTDSEESQGSEENL
jgi:two-component system sensor histidine kinase ChiS